MLYAFMMGMRHGYARPSDLRWGLTFGDKRDDLYDKGANIGQRIGGFIKRMPVQS